MNRRLWMTGAAATAISPIVGSEKSAARLRIRLDQKDPSKSSGVVLGEREFSFPVGFGKNGYLPRGSAFRAGHSLLGEFEINAILTTDSFLMTDALVRESGKSREWLETHLFANMSRIDFDGDGRGGEYGGAFIGLAPLQSEAKQPFHFGEYKGVFRWYSYAIHGTQDESRIGKCVTGGCINVGEEDLQKLIKEMKIGSVVEVIDRGA